jgi:aminoglycoside phosphotransferase (APT) family kinase protein
MDAPLPWRSERPLDAALVERIVAARFPALAPLPATFVDEGWDSEVYAVGEWVLRFPKRAEVVPSQQLERTLLPKLAARLPLPIPRPELLGEPGADFPFPFLGYRRLPGVPAAHVAPDRVDAPVVARRLAEFVTALHETSPAEVAGVPERPPADPIHVHERRLATWLLVRDALPEPLRARGDAFYAAPPPPATVFPLRLVHGDLTYDHILLRPDGGDVAGVIDWGDVAWSDPSWEFAGALAWWGDDFARRMLADYRAPADPGLLERARRGAVYASANAVWWGLTGNRPRDVAAGTRGLELSLP